MSFSVQVGDIFRDKDPRSAGRHVKVLEWDGVRFARCVTCAADGEARGSLPRTRISLYGLETRFERVGTSSQQSDLEATVVSAAKEYVDVKLDYEKAIRETRVLGSTQERLTDADARLVEAVGKVKGGGE